MAKLKLGSIPDDKPVKLAVELPAAVHRDLLAYTEVLARETGQPIADPSKLVAPMLARFMATDRAFKGSTKKSYRRRGIAFPEKFQETRQSWIVVVSPPMRRIADPARAGAVTYLSIDQTGEACADV
jgi:hypothetical protein